MITATMTEKEYHERRELSSTGARRILDSPARFRYWADHPQPRKAAFDLGTAAHTKILGIGADIIEYPEEHLTPSGNVSTKAATVEWYEEQVAQGLTPVSAADARRVDAMAEAVLADADARRILESMEAREVSIVTTVDGVPVRARMDLYDGMRAADLKTSRDASPRGFNRSVGAYGYHHQACFYDDAHHAETGRRFESFKFLVVEAAPPHLVGVYDLDFGWQQKAEEDMRLARATYKQCVATDEWPGYGAHTLIAPTWIVMEGEDTEIQI